AWIALPQQHVPVLQLNLLQARRHLLQKLLWQTAEERDATKKANEIGTHVLLATIAWASRCTDQTEGTARLVVHGRHRPRACRYSPNPIHMKTGASAGAGGLFTTWGLPGFWTVLRRMMGMVNS